MLQEKLFEAVKREGMDLNDAVVQQKITARRIQIETMLVAVIVQQTKHCGCKNSKEI